MNLFYQPLIPEGVHHLDSEESKHCVKVLRKTNGAELNLTDGKGYFYRTVITKADAHRCVFEIKSKTAADAHAYKIHIAISPTKNSERIEWFVEKAVELGVDTISFMECKNTERPYLKLERLEKVAISAMKQSLKASIPSLQGLVKFSDVIKNSIEQFKFIAYVDHTNPDQLKNLIKPASSYIALIGPEGDFTPSELDLALMHGFQKVSLGNSRLRTETAGLAACHTLNLFQ